jgi:hypothetical protein
MQHDSLVSLTNLKNVTDLLRIQSHQIPQYNDLFIIQRKRFDGLIDIFSTLLGEEESLRCLIIPRTRGRSPMTYPRTLLPKSDRFPSRFLRVIRRVA